MINRDEIHGFTLFIHHCAGQATRHLTDTGVLQLTAVHPATGHAIYPRFKIGGVEVMVDAALRLAGMGYNVWVQGRTVRNDLPDKRSPRLEETVWVFALVVDYDGAGRAPFADPESFAVQTSSGHAHLWYLTSMSLVQALEISPRFKATAGADSDSGVITQDYRVPGTPNYPTPRKAAAGRVTEPTFGLSHRFSRAVYSFEDFDRLLPPSRTPNTPVFFMDEPEPRTPMQVLEYLAVNNADRLFSLPVKSDRSGAFCKATIKAFSIGIRPKELEGFILEFGRGGPASKWIEQGKLRSQLSEQWRYWLGSQSLKNTG